MIRQFLDAVRSRAWSKRPACIETLSPPDPARKPDLLPVVRALVDQLTQKNVEEDMRRREVAEFVGELREAALMGGSGPWQGPFTIAEAMNPAKSSAVASDASCGVSAPSTDTTTTA